MATEKTAAFIREHRHEDVMALALKGSDDIDMSFALNQIAGWQKARTKLPLYAQTDGIIYPPHLSMEQCSSEETARYKAEMAGNGELLVDLTGGFGVDFSWMCRSMRRAVYVEQQEALCEAARNNFPLLGIENAEVVCDDGVSYLHQLQHASVIFLDPARRDGHGSKTILLQDCTPDVTLLRDELLEKGDTVILKLSPMLDWHRAVRELEKVAEVHIVALNNECKELLLKLRRDAGTHPEMFCVNLTSDGKGTQLFRADGNGKPEQVTEDCRKQGTADRESQANEVSDTPQFLYDPNVAIMKAGCFEAVGKAFGVNAVSANSHLFLSNKPLSGFPGRAFAVSSVTSLNKKELKRALQGVSHANIAIRNFPLTAVELRKRLRLKDGGETFIFGTTTREGKHLLYITTPLRKDNRQTTD